MKQIIILLITISFSFSAAHSADGVNFYAESSYSEILAKAKAQGKNVLLDFTASWCIPCKKMDREVFSNGEVGNLLNKKFVNFKVNVDYFWGMDVAEKFRIKGYPTILIISPSENVIKRLEGYQDTHELIQAVQYL